MATPFHPVTSHQSFPMKMVQFCGIPTPKTMDFVGHISHDAQNDAQNTSMTSPVSTEATSCAFRTAVSTQEKLHFTQVVLWQMDQLAINEYYDDLREIQFSSARS